ncbi:hypothetical protein [Kitasatospora sp. CMC57]
MVRTDAGQPVGEQLGTFGADPGERLAAVLGEGDQAGRMSQAL